MTEDQTKNVELFKRLTHLLDKAEAAEKYAQLRSRFASAEQWEEEGPKVHAAAYGYWIQAKTILFENRETLNLLIRQVPDFSTPYEIASYRAACRVMDKEIEQSFEQFLLEAKHDEKDDEEQI